MNGISCIRVSRVVGVRVKIHDGRRKFEGGPNKWKKSITRFYSARVTISNYHFLIIFLFVRVRSPYRSPSTGNFYFRNWDQPRFRSCSPTDSQNLIIRCLLAFCAFCFLTHVDYVLGTVERCLNVNRT